MSLIWNSCQTTVWTVTHSFIKQYCCCCKHKTLGLCTSCSFVKCAEIYLSPVFNLILAIISEKIKQFVKSVLYFFIFCQQTAEEGRVKSPTVKTTAVLLLLIIIFRVFSVHLNWLILCCLLADNVWLEIWTS